MKRSIILFLTMITACQQSYGITDKLGGFLPHPVEYFLKRMFGSMLTTNTENSNQEPTPTPSNVFIPSEWKGYEDIYNFFRLQSSDSLMKFFAANPDKVLYIAGDGQSILDLCIFWDKSEELFDFVLQIIGNRTTFDKRGYNAIHCIRFNDVNKLDKLLKINPQIINQKTQITEKTALDLWEGRFEHCLYHNRDKEERCDYILNFIQELKKRGAKRSYEL